MCVCQRWKLVVGTQTVQASQKFKFTLSYKWRLRVLKWANVYPLLGSECSMNRLWRHQEEQLYSKKNAPTNIYFCVRIKEKGLKENVFVREDYYDLLEMFSNIENTPSSFMNHENDTWGKLLLLFDDILIFHKIEYFKKD